jgi:hypothetical protein
MMKIKVLLLVIGLVLTVGLVSAQNCESQTFCKVTPGVFNNIKDFTENYGNLGIQIPDGNCGDISKMGATAHFEYNGCDKLTIQFTKLPFFVSEDLANSKLNAFITQFIPE